MTGRAAATLLLLPPSEGKAAGGRGTFDVAQGSFGALAPERRKVLDALVEAVQAAHDDRRAKLLGVRGDLLDRAVDAVHALASGTAPALPAASRYTGVVWGHLGATSLDRSARSRILVPSALLGVTTGADPVPDHRLKFTVSLPSVGRLDRWWRPLVTDAVARRARGRTIVDLLPNEHAAALDWSELGERCDVVRVRFVQRDGRSAAGHAAKAVKGVAARAVLDEGVDALASFRWEGWRARRMTDGGVDVVAPG